MELSQIRYFLEVAESEHITASAEKLHIAQPALSQSIHRFESEFGLPLFERQGRNIVLNTYGKYLQKKLLPVMKELDSLPNELKALAHVEQNTVYLNVLAASGLLTDAIIEYQEKHKEVKFQLLQNNTAESFDIQVTTKLFYQTEEEENENRFICNEKIYLAVPHNEKFERRNAVSLKEAENEDFISLAGSRQFRFICDKFCRFAGVTPNYIFESDNPAAVQNMIAANMGVGFWPEYSWGKIANKNLRLLPISEPDCSRDIMISYNENSNSVCAKDFYRFLVTKLKKLTAKQ